MKYLNKYNLDTKWLIYYYLSLPVKVDKYEKKSCKKTFADEIVGKLQCYK